MTEKPVEWKCQNCGSVVYIQSCVCENPDLEVNKTEEID